jgi:hypothetical protein
MGFEIEYSRDKRHLLVEKQEEAEYWANNEVTKESFS